MGTPTGFIGRAYDALLTDRSSLKPIILEKGTTNGKVERFNATLAREWAYIREYNSEQERRVALVVFLNHYNHDRPHAGIGHRPPSSRVPRSSYRITGPCPAIPATPHPNRHPEQLTLDLDPVEPTS